MALTNDNLYLASRLWQAVLDASQVPESQLEIAMHIPDPVERMHFVEDLLVGQRLDNLLGGSTALGEVDGALRKMRKLAKT